MRFCVFFADSLLFLLLLPLPFCVTFVSPSQFSPAMWCVLPLLLLCVSHLHRLCGSTWCFSSPLRGVFWGSCVFFFSLPVSVPLFCQFSSGVCWLLVVASWFDGLLGVVCYFLCVFVLGCLVVWLCPRFCVVVASCVSGVCCVSCLCSSVGSVLFWVVRCFVVLLVLLLLCFVCCCSSVSSGWLSWLCCSVRFFAPGGVAPLFWLLLLCVAPSWCWFMRFLLFWWFLVVVGPPPLFLVRHDQARLWFSCGFNAECHPGWVAVWCFCSWRLCLWVVVCHPVGSSGSCFVDHVASWSLCCCSCFVSVVSDSSHLLYGVDVSFYCPVFVSVCVYCCVPCFSAWCCSCLLSMAVCSCLLSVHVFCGLCCKCCSGVLPPCLFTVYPFSPVFVPFFVIFR